MSCAHFHCMNRFNIYNAKKNNNDYLFVCLSNLSHKYVRNLISSNLQASVRKNLSINEQMQLEVSSLMFCFLFSSSELILVKRERWVACFQLAICLKDRNELMSGCSGSPTVTGWTSLLLPRNQSTIYLSFLCTVVNTRHSETVDPTCTPSIVTTRPFPLMYINTHVYLVNFTYLLLSIY